MARCCLARTVTVVSLTVNLSAVGLPASSCHLLHPLLQPLREVAYSVYPAHWFHLYSVNMSSYYDSKEKSHHSKALTSPYPGSSVERSKVPSDKVGWLVEWKDYSPVEYTAASILAGPKWADPQISDKHFSLKFNEKDGQVERKSLSGLYKIENGRPRNPVGRTGLVGRGLLGRWGPNHAADPIITRWKRDKSGSRIAHPVSGKNILQFVAIKRKDCGEWAIPGGMVDPGEKISATLKREFSEEALNSLQKCAAEIKELEQQLDRLFNQQHLVVYKGYVDDPRNTDNAWLETEAVNYHDESGETMDNMPLEAGDDAGKVKWVDISEKLKLYANHSHFIKLVAEKRGAHWMEEPVTDCQK
ncbi:ADP-ribose pyrophosphatase, mitochondrial isoform X1 [Alligator sinensis]|uniref:ADP-ribose pyrophosphatase, mitochondrial n=1 Tax=Alligator sinensis TaxID=38654 RepID=A0A1U7RHI0_ALLSI|nr:ADP-ribose pyrophosphatase, mitochondrial isoform X1 [Alligator sinensis]XP_006018161.1 ADP-ribose pyrophosphatase, mitochondrial isoform X1 [Alligator sinensis]XP_006018162.1 ADP-ribose pyrophosphatase, mitochondrial isoform X1 [Alligator sinensis]XP_025053045.1 ADP-ribose pyrophosphatase, mitochondrial isoform X1 [Alligator sinensis]